MAYNDKILDHYENPRNVGSLDRSDEHVGTGIVGAPECGDVMKLQIQVAASVVENLRDLNDAIIAGKKEIPAAYRNMTLK